MTSVLRVVVLSDTHGAHWDITKYNKIPDGDVLVVTGDFQSYGKKRELINFNEWLGVLPHMHKIVIAGNHDRTAWLQQKEDTKLMFKNAIYLQDEELVIGGIKFYGFPWTPEFCGWHFMLDRGSDKFKRKCELIPEDTDVLLSHGPPMYKLDWSEFGKEHMGSEELRDRVELIKPRYHIFGHNHAGYGGTQNEHTTFINAATCNEKYLPVNKPVCFGITRR